MWSLNNSSNIKRLLTVMLCLFIIVIIALLIMFGWFFYRMTENGGIWKVKEVKFQDTQSIFIKVNEWGGITTTHSQIRLSRRKGHKVYKDDYVFRDGNVYYYHTSNDTLYFFTDNPPDTAPAKFNSNVKIKILIIDAYKGDSFRRVAAKNHYKMLYSFVNNPFPLINSYGLSDSIIHP